MKFGKYHSYNDYFLYLSSKNIGSAEVKTRQREIPGADGYLDLSECFGRLNYGKRKLKFEFVTYMNNNDFNALFSKIQRDIHGKKMKIVIDDDSRFYYYGRVFVVDLKTEGKMGKITVECDCDAYKYRIYETVRMFDISLSSTQVLVNLSKPCVPVFVTDSAMSIVFGGKTYTIASAGTYSFGDFILNEGNNVVCFNGTGGVTVKYREGML